MRPARGKKETTATFLLFFFNVKRSKLACLKPTLEKRFLTSSVIAKRDQKTTPLCFRLLKNETPKHATLSFYYLLHCITMKVTREASALVVLEAYETKSEQKKKGYCKVLKI